LFCRTCRIISTALIILTITYFSAFADECGPSQNELKQFFYSRWIGVKAPEFDDHAKDRLQGPRIKLENYRGKRVLLYSYYTGNFVNGPPEEEYDKIYQRLFKAIDIRNQIGSDKIEVIIMTMSPDLYFLPPADQIKEEDKEFRRLKNVPIIMNFSPKPYDFLISPGAIVIDRNGIIQSMYPRPITEDEIKKAATDKDWDKPVKLAPTELNWEGLKKSAPSMKEKHVWSKNIPHVLGMASTDFQEIKTDKLLAVDKDGKMLVISSEGNIEDQIDIPVKIDGKSATIHWAALAEDKMAFIVFDDPCKTRVTAFDKAGRILWEYPASGEYTINSVAFTKISKDKRVTLLVSLVDSNNKNELHLVSSQGKKLWQIEDSTSSKNLAFINRERNQPGLILRPKYGGGINLLDDSGKHIRTISKDVSLMGVIAVAAMKQDGCCQMIAISPHRSVSYFGKSTRFDMAFAFAVAMNFEGNVMWRLPLSQRDDFDFSAKPIAAADVNNDGIKEWIIHTLDGQIIVVDKEGSTIINFKPNLKKWSHCSILPRKGKNALFVFSSDEEMNAYELEPVK